MGENTEMTSAENNTPPCINLQMMRSSHFIMKAYDDAYRPFGVKATQMPVLGIVSRLQPVTIKIVADEMESERSAISRKMQVMEKNGWVKEDPDTTGKEKSFKLTAKGRNLIERIKPVRSAVQKRIFSALSPAEQELLMSLCGKLKTVL